MALSNEQQAYYTDCITATQNPRAYVIDWILDNVSREVDIFAQAQAIPANLQSLSDFQLNELFRYYISFCSEQQLNSFGI